jgi:hypothetical protein
MTRYAMVLAAVLLGAPAIAQDVREAPAGALASEPDPLAPAPPAEVQKVQACEGERFVFAWGVGSRPTRVTLCSEKGATPAEIITMLQDAARKIDASSLPEDRRTAIALQIRAKIAELQGQSAAVLEPPARTAVPTVSPVAPRPVAPPVRTAPPAGPAPLTPSPPPAAPAAAVAALPAPKLQIHCYTPGQIGSGGPCTVLGRDTRLTIRAGDALAAGTSLRFFRGGTDRAEVAIGQLRKGQPRTLTLPRELCAGVVEAEMEIRVTRSERVIDTLGPLLLRC